MLLIAGSFVAGTLACAWLFRQGNVPITATSSPMQFHSNGTSAKTRNDNLSPSHDGEPPKAQAASSGLLAAFQELARSTSLPEGSIDPSGRTLPKEFATYLANENRGYDQFVAGLSADGIASFNVFEDQVRNLGAVRITEFVAKIGVAERPSAFDFVLYSGLRGLVHEYPAINDVAKADITRHWTSLAQSPNPVFRLLAITEAHRVIRDKAVALALLDTRTSEVDPVIVQALIDQLAVIGGDAAKAALTRVSDTARARRDQVLSNAADDAIAKLK